MRLMLVVALLGLGCRWEGVAEVVEEEGAAARQRPRTCNR